MDAESSFLRILFVEDHADTAEVFARALALRGHTVRVAHNFSMALALAGGNYLDLLLSDIALPDGNGCDLLRILRQYPHLRNMRAIAFTALCTTDDLNRISVAGYDAHVLKPADIDELARTIERVSRAPGTSLAAPL